MGRELASIFGGGGGGGGVGSIGGGLVGAQAGGLLSGAVGLGVGLTADKEPPPGRERAGTVDEQAEAARRREIARLRRQRASGQTRKSGSVAQALSGNIGRVTLGGGG